MLDLLIFSQVAWIRPSTRFQTPDIRSVPDFLLTFELAIVSVLHIFAFPSRGLDSDSQESRDAPVYKGGFLGIRAIWDAFNVWDLVKSVARGLRWLLMGKKEGEEDGAALLNPLEDFVPKSYENEFPQPSKHLGLDPELGIRQVEETQRTQPRDELEAVEMRDMISTNNPNEADVAESRISEDGNYGISSVYLQRS